MLEQLAQIEAEGGGLDGQKPALELIEGEVRVFCQESENFLTTRQESLEGRCGGGRCLQLRHQFLSCLSEAIEKVFDEGGLIYASLFEVVVVGVATLLDFFFEVEEATEGESAPIEPILTEEAPEATITIEKRVDFFEVIVTEGGSDGRWSRVGVSEAEDGLEARADLFGGRREVDRHSGLVEDGACFGSKVTSFGGEGSHGEGMELLDEGEAELDGCAQGEDCLKSMPEVVDLTTLARTPIGGGGRLLGGNGRARYNLVEFMDLEGVALDAGTKKGATQLGLTPDGLTTSRGERQVLDKKGDLVESGQMSVDGGGEAVLNLHSFILINTHRYYKNRINTHR